MQNLVLFIDWEWPSSLHSDAFAICYTCWRFRRVCSRAGNQLIGEGEEGDKEYKTSSKVNNIHLGSAKTAKFEWLKSGSTDILHCQCDNIWN